jgi:hypothetical protein
MVVRLLLGSYITRVATYLNGGYEEGVFLAPDDENHCRENHAFDCNELIFNLMKDWWRKDPITE